MEEHVRLDVVAPIMDISIDNTEPSIRYQWWLYEVYVAVHDLVCVGPMYDIRVLGQMLSIYVLFHDSYRDIDIEVLSLYGYMYRKKMLIRLQKEKFILSWLIENKTKNFTKSKICNI